MFVEIVEDGLRVRIVFEFDNDTDVFRRLVADVTDALQFFLVHEIGYLREKVRFVHAERYRGDDYLVFLFFSFYYLRVPPFRRRFGIAAGMTVGSCFVLS